MPPLLFGSNLQWERAGDGASVDGSWLPGLVSAVTDAGVTALRFPGGSLANTYRWQSGVGPLAARPPGRSFSGQLLPSLFGSDELLRLCRETRTQGVITVNVAAGPNEAADWVEFLNGDVETTQGARRAALGNPRPLSVRYWEIGNELYSPKEPGHLPPRAYGERVAAFGRAMKARDPSIKIGAHLEIAFMQAAWSKRVLPELEAWNEEVLRTCGNDIDFVAAHFYAPFDAVSDEKRLHELVWAGAQVLEQNLERLRRLLARHARPGVELALTEYGTFFGEKIEPRPRIGTTENALFTALVLFQAMRANDVQLANHWSLLNNSSFGMLQTVQGRVVPRPTYAAIRGLSAMAGGTLLRMRIEGDGYSVTAKGNIPALERVPFVDGVAVRGADQRLRAAVVNRSFARESKLHVRLQGTGLPSSLTLRTLVPADTAGTAWIESQRAGIVPGVEGEFDLRLPAQSLSFLEGVLQEG